MVIWLDASINRLTLRFRHRYALQVIIDASMAVIGLEKQSLAAGNITINCRIGVSRCGSFGEGGTASVPSHFSPCYVGPND